MGSRRRAGKGLNQQRIGGLRAKEQRHLTAGKWHQKQTLPCPRAEIRDWRVEGVHRPSPVRFSKIHLPPQNAVKRRQLLHLVQQRRSEEHTSELQSRGHLVCRLLLEKKKSCEEGKATAGRTVH